MNDPASFPFAGQPDSWAPTYPARVAAAVVCGTRAELRLHVCRGCAGMTGKRPVERRRALGRMVNRVLMSPYLGIECHAHDMHVCEYLSA